MPLCDLTQLNRPKVNIDFEGSKGRVLVVDDEQGVLNFISVSLLLAGYDVVTSTSGEKALEIVETSLPDIMVLDLMMAPMTGFAVLEKLRRPSQLPVIAISARQDMSGQAIKEGASSFIAKPFTPAQLLRALEDLLDGHAWMTQPL